MRGSDSRRINMPNFTQWRRKEKEKSFCNQLQWRRALIVHVSMPPSSPHQSQTMRVTLGINGKFVHPNIKRSSYSKLGKWSYAPNHYMIQPGSQRVLLLLRLQHNQQTGYMRYHQIGSSSSIFEHIRGRGIEENSSGEAIVYRRCTSQVPRGVEHY